ncbi:hypothetical protein [Chitinophaga japonensis]|uniref:hypothetical protein n=1 Tax=Chitinophaga japonensis TaxID=104662 RepID=UPI0031D1BDDE
MKFDILENGLDYVKSGTEHIIKEHDFTAYKYAILHLSAGVELILKDRIRREHWTLIFDNINQAKYSLLSSGDFKSIDFETILNRLVNICVIEISDKDIRILKDLRNLRNKIQHFEFTINVQAVRSVCSKVLSIVLNFVNTNFERKHLSISAKNYIDELRELQGKFSEYVKLRTAQIKELLTQAAKKGKIEICPMCRQPALIINEEHCAFCGYTDAPENIAVLYAENILDESAHIAAMHGGEFPVYDCPYCECTDTMVKKNDEFICFNCGVQSHETDFCYCCECGELFLKKDDEDIEICETCWDNKLNSSD